MLATSLLRRDLAIPARFLLLRSLAMMSPLPPLRAALHSQFPALLAQLPPCLRTFLRLRFRLSLRRKLRLLRLLLREVDREDRRWSDGLGCCGKSDAHCGRGRGRLMFDAGRSYLLRCRTCEQRAAS
ncbi:hypothetical protein AAV28_37985 [Bradyrhizobium diazoefficiens USDA 110]|nr:hypothetical protein AAV28_37985 [Bradyrhizobium diazoefficiens USDA 110]